MSDLYDQLVKREQWRLLSKLTEKQYRLSKQIFDLTEEIENNIDLLPAEDDNNGNSLTNVDDRRRIISDMKNDFSDRYFNSVTKNLGSLFHHVDNIRNVYSRYDLECPSWYLEKYGDKLLIQIKKVSTHSASK
jgi:hypothetical protein